MVGQNCIWTCKIECLRIPLIRREKIVANKNINSLYDWQHLVLSVQLSGNLRFKNGPLKTAKDQNLMLDIKHMVNIH